MAVVEFQDVPPLCISLLQIYIIYQGQISATLFGQEHPNDYWFRKEVNNVCKLYTV